MPHLTLQIHEKTHDIFLADYNRLVHLCGLLRLAGAARTLQRVYLMSCIVGFLCWSPDRCTYYTRPTKICTVILPHNRIPTFHSVPCSLGDVHLSFISSVESQNPVPGHSPRPVSPSPQWQRTVQARACCAAGGQGPGNWPSTAPGWLCLDPSCYVYRVYSESIVSL